MFRKHRPHRFARPASSPAASSPAARSPAARPASSPAPVTIYVFASQKDESPEVLDRWLKYVKLICSPKAIRLVDADSTLEETVKWLSEHEAEIDLVRIHPPQKCPVTFPHDYFTQWVRQFPPGNSVYIPLTVTQFPAIRFNRYPPTVIRGLGVMRNSHVLPLADPSNCEHSARALRGIQTHTGTWQARVFRKAAPTVLGESDDSKIVVVGKALAHPSAITDSGFHATTTGAQLGIHEHLIIVDLAAPLTIHKSKSKSKSQQIAITSDWQI